MMPEAPARNALRLFLCGDVMTGRGIDQVLPHPVPPHLFEPWVKSANRYVELAEQASGPIGRRLDFTYPWGDALALLAQFAPALRIVNLETAVTTSEDWDRDKGIHYRMHPRNLPCLAAARIDCCVLANNHVLDWGPAGLRETLSVLGAAGMRTAGAGHTAPEAAEPAALALPGGGRVLVFAFATASSGVPASWAARAAHAGVNFLERATVEAATRIAGEVQRRRQRGDIVVVSVHWGGNWGFAIPREHRDFAHALVAAGGADILHGHSSHHVQGIEVVGGKLVLYGCGDFINDYEGIGGYESHRPELALMYLPELDRATGDLRRLLAVPMRRRRLRLERADAQAAAWLATTLAREGQALGTRVRLREDGALSLDW
jgi:poly-gamma-glutamate synthesis protein (capsule biosynthesis protein)